MNPVRDLLSFQSEMSEFRTETRGEFADLRSRADEHDRQFGEVHEELGDIKSTLLRILDRLPPPPRT